MSLSEEQKRLRRTGLGASEIGAVAGLNPFANAFDVYRAKVEDGFTVEETEPMKRGRHLEPAVCSWYAEDFNAALREVGTVRHRYNPIALATPDRIATVDGEDRVLEVKTANMRQLDKWGESGSDKVPEQYLVQSHWLMAVTDLYQTDLAALIGGDDFRVFHLARDRDLEGQLLELGERFWLDYVVPRKPPPVDGSPSCAAFLATAYAKSTGEVVKATPEAAAWARELQSIRKAMKETEARKALVENHLRAFVGSASLMEFEGGQLRMIDMGESKPFTSTRKAHRQIRFAKEQPNE